MESHINNLIIYIHDIFIDSVSLASTWRLCHLQSFLLQFGHIPQSQWFLWSLGLNESSKGELEGLVETVPKINYVIRRETLGSGSSGIGSVEALGHVFVRQMIGSKLFTKGSDGISRCRQYPCHVGCCCMLRSPSIH